MHNGKYISRYDFWDPSTWTIPKLYWDAFSQEQRIHALCRQLAKVIAYADYVGANTDNLIAMQKDLEAQFEKFQDGGFLDIYEDVIQKWITDNIDVLIGESIRSVYFGLTRTGYFVAYIPDSWDDIVFDTGMDYTLDTYGRLILRMDVDSPGDEVDQTPEVVRYPDEYLVTSIENMMNTLYAVDGD